MQTRRLVHVGNIDATQAAVVSGRPSHPESVAKTSRSRRALFRSRARHHHDRYAPMCLRRDPETG